MGWIHICHVSIPWPWETHRAKLHGFFPGWILLPLRCYACMSALSSIIQHDKSTTSYRVALTRSVEDHLYVTYERSFIIVSPANMKELKFRAARKLFWIQSAHLMLSNKKCNIFPHSCSATNLWVETPAAVSRAPYAAELQRAFEDFSLLEPGVTLMCCSKNHFCEQNKCVWAASRWVHWVIKCNLTSLL